MVGPLAKPTTEQLIKAAEMRGAEEGILQAWISLLGVLVNDFDKLLPFDTRLETAETLITQNLKNIEHPSEKQEFAEWLYQKQTGNTVKREDDNMKPYTKELAQILKDKMAELDMVQETVRQKLSLRKAEWQNVMWNNKPKKDTFDKIAGFLGINLTDEQQKMYDECFRDRRCKRAKFVQMEKDLKTRNAEKAQEWLDKLFPGSECKVLSAEPIPVKPSVMPVDEPKPIEPTVEQATEIDEPKNEELPFSDCNEMYKEAEKEPSAVQILERKVAEAEAELIDCESLIKEKEAEIEALKTRQKQLDVAVTQINNSINIMKEAGL